MDTNIVSTLRSRITDVERYIAETEKRLESARHDLAHLQATLRLFRLKADDMIPVYIGLTRIFKRGEITRLALTALRASPDGLDTRELALAVMTAKGLDTEDRVFRKTLAQSIVTLLGRLELKRVVRCEGKRRGVKVWRLSSTTCAVDSRH